MKACRRWHLNLSQLPCRVRTSRTWGNVEDSTEFCVQKISCSLCAASCGYTLQNYLLWFHTARVPSAQERSCSVKNLRLWEMSSRKAQSSGLGCYCPWLSALPLWWSLQALVSSTECSCATAAPVVRLVPWFKYPRRWVYDTAGNGKHRGMLHLADSDTMTALSSNSQMDVRSLLFPGFIVPQCRDFHFSTKPVPEVWSTGRLFLTEEDPKTGVWSPESQKRQGMLGEHFTPRSSHTKYRVAFTSVLETKKGTLLGYLPGKWIKTPEFEFLFSLRRLKLVAPSSLACAQCNRPRSEQCREAERGRSWMPAPGAV